MGGGLSAKSYSRAGILVLVEGDGFLVSADWVQLCVAPSSSSSSLSSEPPEAYIDDEHDEKDTSGCQLGIGGAGVEILGVAPVLLGQAGQVAGLRVQRCGEEGRDTEEGRIINYIDRPLKVRSIESGLMGLSPAANLWTHQREPLLAAAPPLCWPP